MVPRIDALGLGTEDDMNLGFIAKPGLFAVHA
jgi:hypothetical protein